LRSSVIIICAKWAYENWSWSGENLYVRIRQHTSAYASIRQHTPAYASIRQHTSTGPGRGRTYTSAYVRIRPHTFAYVSIRQHTSAYVSIRQHTSTGCGRGRTWLGAADTQSPRCSGAVACLSSAVPPAGASALRGALAPL
jgi:hypothetical protein